MARTAGRPNNTSADSPEEQSEDAVIAKHGDVCLKIKDRKTGLEHRYRCSRNTLRGASDYFDVLFDPVKFGEGIATEAKLQELYKHHAGAVPFTRLPIVAISDVGELPNTKVSQYSLLRLFLMILHDPATPWPADRSESVNLVALLAIVADRFAAHRPVAEYLRKHMLDVSLLKNRKSTSADKSELDNRQKLLAGMTFGFSQWVLQCSSALVVEGVSRRMSRCFESGDEAAKCDNDAPWWRLPSGIEEEILCRREYVLDTINSIQKHFIALYSSRQPQCRLGYGSSPNCDSYQLGEMIRFFSRKGLLRIESAFAATPEEYIEPYEGNIDDIIAKLKECPSYQIDHNHSHCGLRTRLLPILDSLWPLNSVWICLDCWRADKGKESWLDSPQGGKWYWCKKLPLRTIGGCQTHQEAKAMYTAATRDWTPAYSA